MLRVFHVPSHLSYVAKLAGPAFAPTPSPAGRPLQIGELAAWPSWDFFDVAHLHSVELATINDIERLAARAASEKKRLVFTAHDLVPNIERDRAAFDRKTALTASRAAAVATLTEPAALKLARSIGVPESAVHVIPHGAALPLSSLEDRTIAGQGVAAFGALRPNRDLLALVRAWATLPARPPLQVLVRSVSAADRDRYASVLAELDQVGRAEPELRISTRSDVVPPDDLASWCRQSSVLVLPYRHITHSGQLELARDLGLRVLAPDVPTLRAQLAQGPPCPTEWFPLGALDEPNRFADHLQRALSLPSPERDGSELRRHRTAEHRWLLDAHHELYFQHRPEKM